MIEKLHNYLNQLVGTKLESINLACQMIVLDFGKFGIHCQSFTRISKDNDILFTTYDYQSWDEEESENNDEWFFLDKYKNKIINGVITEVNYNKMNDVKLTFDNGITIEIFVANGYHHYAEEQEQWRFLIDIDNENCCHIVVYNKHIEIA